jgi:hypothetical protein
MDRGRTLKPALGTVQPGQEVWAIRIGPTNLAVLPGVVIGHDRALRMATVRLTSSFVVGGEQVWFDLRAPYLYADEMDAYDGITRARLYFERHEGETKAYYSDAARVRREEAQERALASGEDYRHPDPPMGFQGATAPPGVAAAIGGPCKTCGRNVPPHHRLFVKIGLGLQCLRCVADVLEESRGQE